MSSLAGFLRNLGGETAVGPSKKKILCIVVHVQCPPHTVPKNNPSLRLKTEPVTAGADATKYCTVRVCLVYGVYSIAGHNTVQYEYVWFMVFTV